MTVGDASKSDLIPNAEKAKSADLETLFNAEVSIFLCLYYQSRSVFLYVKGSFRDVVTNELNCDMVVSEFEL